MAKILMVNGSHNKDGNVAYLLNLLGEECSKYGLEWETVSAHDAVMSAKTPFCVCCSTPCNKQCYKGTHMEEVLNKIIEADGVIFGTPVYFGDMSAQLKCLFDKTRAIRAEKKTVGKLGCAIACGASRFGGQELTVTSVNNCMFVDGFTVIGPSSKDLGCGHVGICAQKPSKDDAFAIERVKMLAKRLYEELNH